MEHSSNISAAARVFRLRRHASRSGKISVVTTLGVLGLIILAGYVGNVGNSVAKKLETQNAADSVAFSSAQWMARGMNAVTATNHLLGEATSVVITIEALGGPEYDEGMEAYPDIVKGIDEANRKLADTTAPLIVSPAYGAIPPLTNIDKQLVDVIVNQIVSPSGNREKFHAFATIYDSKVALKKATTIALIGKTLGNVLLLIPPPFGYPTAPVAWAAHIAADIALLKIAQEYILVEVIEGTLVGLKPIKVAFQEMIPGLVKQGDFLAGKENNGNGPVNDAVADEFERLGKAYFVAASLFPEAKDLRLPIAAEPEPSLAGTTSNEPEWGDDALFKLPSMEDAMNADFMKDALKDFKDPTKKNNEQITEFREQISTLDGMKAGIDTELAGGKLSEEDKTKFTEERARILESRRRKEVKIAELEESNREIAKNNSEMNDALGKMKSAAGGAPGNGNLSNKPEHLALRQMKQSEERCTQWVRATYPYVDSYRATLLAQFETLLLIAETKSHYTKWTNRYTLTNAWEFRSGFRFSATGKEDGQWTKQKDLMHMYAMLDSFGGDGDRKEQKGHENWTQETDDAKERAEKLFTLIGITQRDKATIFSPKLYKRGPSDSITTLAQAIFYNANEQRPEPIGSKLQRQPVLGWDTLNWDPTTPAPEWGAEARVGNAKWPWELFENGAVSPTTNVRLNWQAKLMPVTEGRFNEAVEADLANESMKNDLTKAKQFFKQLVTH
jgi:hypothetical protein